jgi:hypothetical protein
MLVASVTLKAPVSAIKSAGKCDSAVISETFIGRFSCQLLVAAMARRRVSKAFRSRGRSAPLPQRRKESLQHGRHQHRHAFDSVPGAAFGIAIVPVSANTARIALVNDDDNTIIVETLNGD